MTVKQSYKNIYYNDCDSVTSWTHVVTVFLEAAGYVSCVAGDLNKYVCTVGGGVCTATHGTLIGYDNTNRIWSVATTTVATTIAGATTLGIDANGAGAPDGTGAGTRRAGIVSAARTFTTDGDMFRLGGTTANTSDQEYFYEELDLTDFSATTYPVLLIRHKTDTASAALQAYAQVIYDDATTSNFNLGYSATWKVTKCALTTGKTVSKIRLFAYEDAAANANGSYSAYYDWFIFCAGVFTYPHVAPGDVRIHYAMKKAQIEIPGRDGDILQRLGQKSPQITVNGNVLPGETWESADPDFDYFLRSIQIDTISYFSCDKPDIRGLVMWSDFEPDIHTSGSESDLRWQLSLILFKLNSYSYFQDWEWMYGSETGF